MIRLVIADDHPIVRAGLRAVFGSDERFEVVADVASAEEAIALCAADPQVELVTMDLQFPSGMSGVEAVEALSALEHPPLVLVLTNYDTDDSILAAIEAGARGYLLKDALPAELLDAARRAAAGEVVLPAHLASKMYSRMREPRVTLTPRERDVLSAIRDGLSNREIGERLFLAPTTVKTHVARLFTTLGVSSRTAALARARELGLFDS